MKTKMGQIQCKLNGIIWVFCYLVMNDQFMQYKEKQVFTSEGFNLHKAEERVA